MSAIYLRAALAVVGIALAILALCLVPGANGIALYIPWADGRSLHARLSLGGALFCAGSIMVAVAAWPDVTRGQGR